MNTLDFIFNRFKLDPGQKRMPIEIPDVDRDTLAQLFWQLGFTQGAEIGVERGNYSEVLLKANPNLHLHCVDAWKAYSGYREHVSQEKLDGFFQFTMERLANYKVTLWRGFSVDIAKRFEPNSLDFVYIDGNHTFQHVANDIAEWSRIVRPGGIISGHDYCRRTASQPYSCHVVEVVNAYTQSYHIRPWFVLGSKDVVEGQRRDRPRSWMWVKE